MARNPKYPLTLFSDFLGHKPKQFRPDDGAQRNPSISVPIWQIYCIEWSSRYFPAKQKIATLLVALEKRSQWIAQVGVFSSSGDLESICTIGIGQWFGPKWRGLTTIAHREKRINRRND